MPTYVPLPGSHRVPLPESRPAGPVNLKQLASLTLRVRSKGDMEAFRKRVYEQADLPPAQRQYLTREELEAQHGADPADMEVIEQVAQQHDLRVAYRSDAERSMVLEGELGNLLDAFPADVQMYHHAGGTYRGRQGEIHIPQQLNGIITGIFGYDTRPKHRSPHNRRLLGAVGPGGKNGVAATDFAKRYNFPTQFDGAGQTIAIIELGGGFRPAI